MGEEKAPPNLWAFVMILVAILGSMGVVAAAVIGILPDLRNPTPQLQTVQTDEPTSTNTPPAATAITVYASEGWQDTGYLIEIGDTIEIEYVSGQWTYASDYVALHDADGPQNGYICSQAMSVSLCTEPIPDATKGSLVARIGYTQPIHIGNYSSFVAADAGPLQLSINDSLGSADLADNIGSIVARITVSKSR